jgi:hypothetical protein
MSEKNLIRPVLYPACCFVGVVAVTLKLAGVIEWSWIAVLAPFWIMPLIIFLIVAILLLFAGGCFLLAGILDYFDRYIQSKK